MNNFWCVFPVHIDMSQGAVGDEVDGVVAIVAVVSSKKHNNHSPSPVKVVVPASPESEVEEDGVALLTDAEPPAVREHGDLFASCQLLSDSYEAGNGEFMCTFLCFIY